MINTPIKVADEEFDEKILNGDLPVVVDFWAPWCGPCKTVAPILDKLAEDYSGKVVIAKVNTDEDNQYAAQYGVQGIPTMIFFHEGKLVHRQVGALPEPIMRDLFEQFVNITTKVES
jgi:thioredoxin 1